MLDPFTECPFLLLGLPPTASEPEITAKWKTLMRDNHPDKHGGCTLSNLKTQILNDAKQRATQKIGTSAHEFATSMARFLNLDAATARSEAEHKRVLYEALWVEQERMKKARPASHMDNTYPSKKRKHAATWASNTFSELRARIDQFVLNRVTPSANSFISCKQLLGSFASTEAVQDLDKNFVYRSFATSLEKHHPGAKQKVTNRSGERGYKDFALSHS
jgi:hypothetical protein